MLNFLKFIGEHFNQVIVGILIAGLCFAYGNVKDNQRQLQQRVKARQEAMSSFLQYQKQQLAILQGLQMDNKARNAILINIKEAINENHTEIQANKKRLDRIK